MQNYVRGFDCDIPRCHRSHDTLYLTSASLDIPSDLMNSPVGKYNPLSGIISTETVIHYPLRWWGTGGLNELDEREGSALQFHKEVDVSFTSSVRNG